MTIAEGCNGCGEQLQFFDVVSIRAREQHRDLTGDPCRAAAYNGGIFGEQGIC